MKRGGGTRSGEGARGALEFTGERYVPGQGGARIAYEHVHRYLFARRWARGRRVLDVATGSGYGARLLAESARSVCAIEIDAVAVAAARDAFGVPNLSFARADAARLPIVSASIDLVVALEILEHVPAGASQEALVAEVARVVRPGGVALLSTPDRATYSDARRYRNPFHTRELYRHELEALLGSHFRFVELFRQQVRAGSLIVSERSDGAREGEIVSERAPVAERSEGPALYFLALAGQAPIAEAPEQSAYLDRTDFLLEELEAEIAALNREVERLNAEIESLGRWGRGLDAALLERDRALESAMAERRQAVEARDGTIRELQETLAREIAARDRQLDERRREIDARARWASSLDAEIVARDASIVHYRRDIERLEALAAELARIRSTRLYRSLRRLGFLP